MVSNGALIAPVNSVSTAIHFETVSSGKTRDIQALSIIPGQRSGVQKGNHGRAGIEKMDEKCEKTYCDFYSHDYDSNCIATTALEEPVFSVYGHSCPTFSYFLYFLLKLRDIDENDMKLEPQKPK